MSWTTACGDDAQALALRRADGSWDDSAAEVGPCPSSLGIRRNVYTPAENRLGQA